MSEENIKATLMVRGIDGLDYNDLQQAFSKLGRVKDIRMILDRFTGGFKNFAFVEFECEEEADLVVKNSVKDQVRVAGRPISVVKSRERKVVESVNVEKKEAEVKLQKEMNCCEKGRDLVNEVFLSNLNGKVGKNDEFSELWVDRLKQSIAICFKCQKWFDTVELGKIHEICHS